MTDDERPRTPTRARRGRSEGGWLRTLKQLSPWGQRRATRRLQASLAEVAARLEADDGRLRERADVVEAAVRSMQNEVAELRDERTARVERRLDMVETAQARLADEVVPAVVERGNVLVDRLSEQIEEVTSLVERMLLDEPLPVPRASAEEALLAGELADVQPALLAAFRGSEREVTHRLQHHLETLASSGPVLDLGCGRGELLLLLREAGVEARGVEHDPALALGARRRGLEILEGDVLAVLRAQPPGAFGAVSAIHLLEHLEARTLLRLLEETRRVLRPGGLLLAECPNPHNLRVGAAFFWQDPTHLRPLLPETLQLYLETSGFSVRSVELLHPFPEEQRFAGRDVAGEGGTPEVTALGERLESLARRLDDVLNGPRDFAVVAVVDHGGGST